jgi:hypothetical protein
MGGGRSTLVRATIVLLLVLLASPLAAAWARTSGGEPVAGLPGIGGFRQSAEVDGETFAENEPVVLTYRVCRSRPWPTRTRSPGPGGDSLVAQFHVLDDRGDVVARPGGGYILLLASTWWWPGQCRSRDFVWDQRYGDQNDPDREAPNGDGTVAGGGRVEPGDHRFEAWWTVASGDKLMESEPTKTTPFLIEP